MAQSSLKPSKRPYPGRLFARRYEVVEQIAEGGMGQVWRALDIERGRQMVAVKVMHPDLSTDEEIQKRFDREMAVTSQVRHPNVVRMLAYGSTRHGLAYLVLEYLEGTLLSDLLAEEGRLPAERAVAIARQIAGALRAAHAAGVVHRDLKAENIMVGENDSVKVLDFGLARFVEGVRQSLVTDAGQRIGTPEYMAPEYISTAEPPDHRVDLYALGVLLFEMLTGEPPFTGKPPRVFERHVKEPTRPPSADVGRLPRRLDRLVLSLLEKDPERRMASADAAARALDGALPVGPSRGQIAAVVAMSVMVALSLGILFATVLGVLG